MSTRRQIKKALRRGRAYGISPKVKMPSYTIRAGTKVTAKNR
jgi:hypothetical protein